MLLLFDLNGTLLDPAGLGRPWHAPELGPAVLQEAVRSAMADTLTGHYRPFDEHLRAAVEHQVALRGLDRALVDAAVAEAAALTPHRGAARVLDAARAAGHRVAVLTNSRRAPAEQALRAAGLAVEAVVSVEEVRAYKPHPAPYRHALARLATEADATMLVSAHAWDVTGAARAGLCTAWVAHGERALTPVAPPPDVRARDLDDLATVVDAL